MNQNLSSGQSLLHDLGVRQGSILRCDVVPAKYRASWVESRPIDKYRKSKKNKHLICDDDLLAVVSQDCDIACKDDSHDEVIELILLKPIASNKIYDGNKFTLSVRNLHIQVDGRYYEAKVQLLVWAKKEDLLECIDENQVVIIPPADEITRIFSRWRSNRYERVALPDKFNSNFLPLLRTLLGNIASYDCIVGLYIWLDSLEESECYAFRFFALLNSDTSNELVSEISDHIENFCEELASMEGLLDRSNFYSTRMNTITLDQFVKYLKVNVEHVSLSSGDEELGPATAL